jgi:hypothetical protein
MAHRESYLLDREDRRKQWNDLPMRAVVRSVLPDLEAVEAEMFSNPGTVRMTILHPYFGVNSWFRVMPERGTPLLTQTRGDLPQQEISRYISNRLAQLHENVKAGEDFLFRVLRPGEMEAISSGRAYTHWGEEGDLQMRGGVSRLDLSQTRLEITGWSPTFRRRLHLHNPTTLAHEERFGVVKRPDLINPNLVEKYVRLTDQSFAVEYGRWINKGDGSPIIEFQEGNVVDTTGKLKTHGNTNKNLRHQRTIHHRTQSGILDYQVDEDLNILFTNTLSSNTQTTVSLGTNNALNLTTKKMKVTVTASGNLSFSNNLTISSRQVNISTADTRFGNNPVFSFLVGEKLVGQVVSPLLAQLASAFALLALEPGISPSGRASLSTFGSAIGALSGNASAALSQQVKLSG